MEFEYLESLIGDKPLHEMATNKALKEILTYYTQSHITKAERDDLIRKVYSAQPDDKSIDDFIDNVKWAKNKVKNEDVKILYKLEVDNSGLFLTHKEELTPGYRYYRGLNIYKICWFMSLGEANAFINKFTYHIKSTNLTVRHAFINNDNIHNIYQADDPNLGTFWIIE